MLNNEMIDNRSHDNSVMLNNLFAGLTDHTLFIFYIDANHW